LGITDAAWPPDHYRLLGLPMGEPNIERIEEQVHRRLESVRRYQLTHPEIVTEAMNRLAQAFVCLTDPAAKRAYDVDLLGEAAAKLPSAPVALQEPPPLAWLQQASEELVPIDDESPMANAESATEPEADAVAIPPLPAEQVEVTPKPVESD